MRSPRFAWSTTSAVLPPNAEGCGRVPAAAQCSCSCSARLTRLARPSSRSLLRKSMIPTTGVLEESTCDRYTMDSNVPAERLAALLPNAEPPFWALEKTEHGRMVISSAGWSCACLTVMCVGTSCFDQES